MKKLSKKQKHQLEKKIMIFLSSGLFAIAGLGSSDALAAAVFTDGTGTNATMAGVNNNAAGEKARPTPVIPALSVSPMSPMVLALTLLAGKIRLMV